MRVMALEHLSTITIIVFIPSEVGRSVMKSSEMCDQGRLGVRSGISLPAGKCLGTLDWADLAQDKTNSLISLHIEDHQYPSEVPRFVECQGPQLPESCVPM